MVLVQFPQKACVAPGYFSLLLLSPALHGAWLHSVLLLLLHGLRWRRRGRRTEISAGGMHRTHIKQQLCVVVCCCVTPMLTANHSAALCQQRLSELRGQPRVITVERLISHLGKAFGPVNNYKHRRWWIALDYLHTMARVNRFGFGLC